jgi:hypothetical protein
MRIRADIFPAHLAVIPEGFFEDVTELRSSPATEGAHYLATTRVIVNETHIIVAQDSPNGAQIVFREEYDEYLPGESTKTDHRVVTKSGKMLAFKKDSNCGCGSRLRSWNPYKTLNSIKD